LPGKLINNPDLFELAKILGQQTDFNEVVRLVAQKSAQFLNADLALILMVNPDTRETVKTIIQDGKSVEQLEYRDIHIHVGGWIISKGKPFLSMDIVKDRNLLNFYSLSKLLPLVMQMTNAF